MQNVNRKFKIWGALLFLLFFAVGVSMYFTAANVQAATKTGFVTINGDSYYINEDGSKQKGWLELEGKKYYFNTKTGVQVKGWVTDSKGRKRYFSKQAGIMMTGWVTDSKDQKRYFDPSTGFMQTKWLTLKGKRYYFYSNSGVAACKTFLTDSKKNTRYFTSACYMLTGWTKNSSNEYRYFETEDGIMAKGFQTLDGKKYYFNTGSGKMAVCLSQLYNENKHGVRAGYAKFETFPVWNLPLKHPVNIAYEAATADLNDVNMIDPFHLEAYGQTTVNYNRDVEIFPVVQAMFEKIMGECPYKSPTDMGVNMAGNCIVDDEVCKEAARQEIIRRYYKSMEALVRGTGREEEVYKIELLLKQAHVTIEERKVVPAALKREEETGAPAAALELPDGRIVTGKTSELLGASSALLLNALKELAGIEHDKHVISPEALKPIQALKTEYLGSKNPRLHSDETLIALSISAADNEDAKLALQQIPKLKGCQVHTSVLLSQVDILQFRKLGVELTCEPKSEHAKKLQK